MGRGDRRGRASGLLAALACCGWLALGLLASVAGSVAGEGVGEMELGADGRQERRPPSGAAEQPSAESTRWVASPSSTSERLGAAAAAEALVWDLVDVARRDGDRQVQKEEAAKQEVGLVEGTNAAIFRSLIPAIEGIRASLPGLYKHFHWAGVLQFILEYGMGCPAITATRTILTNVPPTFGHLHSMRQPVNPDGSLPRPLKDLVGFDGDFIDEATVQAERSTCTYCVFRCVCLCLNGTRSQLTSTPPSLHPSIYLQTIFFGDALSPSSRSRSRWARRASRSSTPSQTGGRTNASTSEMLRPSTTPSATSRPFTSRPRRTDTSWSLYAERSSRTSGASHPIRDQTNAQSTNQSIDQPHKHAPQNIRRKDLQFQFANVAESAPYFDGQVHSGAFIIFQDMIEHLYADLQARRPREVTFTGTCGWCICVCARVVLCFFLCVAVGVPGGWLCKRETQSVDCTARLGLMFCNIDTAHTTQATASAGRSPSSARRFWPGDGQAAGSRLTP